MRWVHRSAIATLREQQQLTQLQLAQMVGVTETTIANWEKGRSGLDWIDRLIRLCDALNCVPEDLIRYIPCSNKDLDGDELASVLNGIAALMNQTGQSSSVGFSAADIKRIKDDGGKFSEIDEFSCMVRNIELFKEAKRNKFPLS